MSALITAAVVVPAAGRETHLRRLLDGLANQTRRPDDVVVADMGDATATLAAARVHARRHPVAVGDHPLPLAAARNGAAATTDTDVLVFLDVDCLPHPELVADYVTALERSTQVLACGQVRYLRQGWDERTPLDDQSAPNPARPAVAAPTMDPDHPDLFWSLNFATTATTWRLLGGFDEGYVGYGAEDTDLGRRAHAQGVPLLWLPAALAYHQWHPPTRLDPARAPDIVANASRFRARWGTWPMAGWLADLHAAGLIRFEPERNLLEVAS